MRTIVANSHGKGLILVFPDKLLGVCGSYIVYLAFGSGGLPVDLKGAIKEPALPPATGRVGEPGSFTALLAYMPFADGGRLPDGFRQSLAPVVQGVGEVGIDVVVVGVLSGQKGGPAGRTQRLYHKGITKADPFGGQAIQMRRLQLGKPGPFALPPLYYPQAVVSLVVGVDEDKVRTFRLGEDPGA